jgi:hypothetical protein
MDDKQGCNGGMKIRREVLGADYGARLMAASEECMLAMQDLTTRFAACFRLRSVLEFLRAWSLCASRETH